MKSFIKNRVGKIDKRSAEFKFYKFVSSLLMMQVYAFFVILYVFTAVYMNVNMLLIIVIAVAIGVSGAFLSVMLRSAIDECEESQKT